MVRIDVSFSDDVASLLARAAESRGVSLEQYVAQSMTSVIERRAKDSFFADTAVWNGSTPKDLAERHDDYLYGEDY